MTFLPDAKFAVHLWFLPISGEPFLGMITMFCVVFVPCSSVVPWSIAAAVDRYEVIRLGLKLFNQKPNRGNAVIDGISYSCLLTLQSYLSQAGAGPNLNSVNSST